MAPRPKSTPRTGRDAGGPRPERLLVGTVLALVSFGLVMVYSTSSATALLAGGNPVGMVVRQGLYALLGLGAFLVASRVRPGVLARLGRPALVGSFLLLLVVLVPGVGTAVNGSRRWLELGSLVQVQPSELAKVGLVLWLAATLGARPERVRERGGQIPFLLVSGAMALLVLIEPDLGTASLIVAVALTMLIVAGASARRLGAVVGTVVGIGLVAIMIAPYRRARLVSFLDPWSDPHGAGFQAVQAQVALGSGGLHGVGLGGGVQKAFYLPEAHTDMILATVGEELGLLGVVAVLGAFALLALTGYRIALRASDLHQQLVAAGLTTNLVAQAVINVGAVLGAVPVTGVPLPFVSFGGSSMVILLASAGLLVNIARRSAGPRAAHVPAAAPRRAARHDRGRGHRRARDAGARGGRRPAGARG